MAEIPTPDQVDAQIADGLQAAWDANRYFDVKQNYEKAFADEAAAYGGMDRVLDARIVIKAANEIRGHLKDPFDLYDNGIEEAQRKFESVESRAAEGIGRGTIGGLYYDTDASPTIDDDGNEAWGHEREYTAGAANAWRAERARNLAARLATGEVDIPWYDKRRDDLGKIDEFDTLAGQYMGRKSDGGMWRDILANTKIAPDDDHRPFSERALATAARNTEYDDEMEARRLAAEEAERQRVLAEQEAARLAASAARPAPYGYEGLADGAPTDEEAELLKWFTDNILLSDRPSGE